MVIYLLHYKNSELELKQHSGQNSDIEAQERYDRVLYSTSCALATYIKMVVTDEFSNDGDGKSDETANKSITDKLQTHLTEIFGSKNPGWSLLSSDRPLVRKGMYVIICTLAKALPEWLDKHMHKVAPVIFNCFGDLHKPNHTTLWDMIIQVFKTSQRVWSDENDMIKLRKQLWPRLWKMIESGAFGSYNVLKSRMLILLSYIPNHIQTSFGYVDFYRRFLGCLWQSCNYTTDLFEEMENKEKSVEIVVEEKELNQTNMASPSATSFAIASHRGNRFPDMIETYTDCFLFGISRIDSNNPSEEKYINELVYNLFLTIVEHKLTLSNDPLANLSEHEIRIYTKALNEDERNIIPFFKTIGRTLTKLEKILMHLNHFNISSNINDDKEGNNQTGDGYVNKMWIRLGDMIEKAIFAVCLGSANSSAQLQNARLLLQCITQEKAQLSTNPNTTPASHVLSWFNIREKTAMQRCLYRVFALSLQHVRDGCMKWKNGGSTGIGNEESNNIVALLDFSVLISTLIPLQTLLQHKETHRNVTGTDMETETKSYDNKITSNDNSLSADEHKSNVAVTAIELASSTLVTILRSSLCYPSTHLNLPSYKSFLAGVCSLLQQALECVYATSFSSETMETEVISSLKKYWQQQSEDIQKFASSAVNDNACISPIALLPLYQYIFRARKTDWNWLLKYNVLPTIQPQLDQITTSLVHHFLLGIDKAEHKTNNSLADVSIDIQSRSPVLINTADLEALDGICSCLFNYDSTYQSFISGTCLGKLLMEFVDRLLNLLFHHIDDNNHISSSDVIILKSFTSLLSLNGLIQILDNLKTQPNEMLFTKMLHIVFWLQFVPTNHKETKENRDTVAELRKTASFLWQNSVDKNMFTIKDASYGYDFLCFQMQALSDQLTIADDTKGNDSRTLKSENRKEQNKRLLTFLSPPNWIMEMNDWAHALETLIASFISIDSDGFATRHLEQDDHEVLTRKEAKEKEHEEEEERNQKLKRKKLFTNDDKNVLFDILLQSSASQLQALLVTINSSVDYELPIDSLRELRKQQISDIRRLLEGLRRLIVVIGVSTFQQVYTGVIVDVLTAERELLWWIPISSISSATAAFVDKHVHTKRYIYKILFDSICKIYFPCFM